MKLSELISKNDILIMPCDAESIDASGVCADSRKLRSGELFFSLDGSKANMYDAAMKNACAVVTDAPPEDRLPARTVIVRDAREAFSLACLHFCGDPQKKLRLCAVTGTNGKTTVASMLSEILKEGGYKTFLIGTEGAGSGSDFEKTGYTTPPPEILSRLLRKAADEGDDFVIMEASSHSLDQKRLFGLGFELGIFTNLTRDHLDYHKSVEAYSAAKAKLFSLCRHSVLNFDDPRAYEMAWLACDEIWYYSASNRNCDFYADNISLSADGTDFDFCAVGLREHISSSLPGEYSVYNMLAAASAACVLGIKGSISARALGRFRGAEGRMEKLETKSGAKVFIDFAHTPDAMRNVISSARRFTAGKIITVFGCGGERDKGKRPEMGKIAAELSDKVIITSDNPRSEDPESIIKDIISEIASREDIIIQPERKAAIELAIASAEKGDTVLLLGKGAEKFISSGGKNIPFSDKETAEDIIFKKGI